MDAELAMSVMWVMLAFPELAGREPPLVPDQLDLYNELQPSLNHRTWSCLQNRRESNQINQTKSICTKGEGEILDWVLPKSVLPSLLRKSIVDFKLFVSDCTKRITSSVPSEIPGSPTGKGSK